MKRIFTLIFLVSTILLQAQNDDKTLIKETIETFFDGFHKGDTTLIKSTLHKDLILQTALKNKEGKDVLITETTKQFLTAISSRTEHQKWEEKLLSYNIQIDYNMANAWTPYEFWYNDTFSHCGVNSFQLFKEGNDWKIIYIIDTRKKLGCQ